MMPGSTETVFILMLIATGRPDMQIALATYDSALKCFAAVEAVKRSASSFHPELDLKCKQGNLVETPE